MEIEVNISAEDIEKNITEAVVNSAVGESMVKEIQDAIKESLTSSYNRDSVIKRLAARQVEGAITDLLLSTYKEQIRAEVAEQITRDLVSDLVSSCMENMRRLAAG